jgi:hypothetical protein
MMLLLLLLLLGGLVWPVEQPGLLELTAAAASCKGRYHIWGEQRCWVDGSIQCCCCCHCCRI